MPKEYKIKRYNQIYSKKRVNPKKVVAIIIALIILFLGGMYIGKTVSNYIQNPPPKEELLPDEESGEGEGVTPEQPPAVAEIPVNSSREVLVGDLINEVKRNQIIGEMKTSGQNTVLVTIKDEIGNVKYTSANPIGLKAGAGSPQKLDITAVSAVLKENGIKLAVKLSAFKDSVSATETRYIKYQGTETRWIDESPQNGGKPWLDPTAPESQDYILSLVDEVYNMGADIVVLDDVNYPPNKSGIKSATYRGGNDPATKQTALKTFVQKAQDKAAEKSKELMVLVDSDETLKDTGFLYGGSAFDLGIKNMVFDFSAPIKVTDVLIDGAPVVLDKANKNVSNSTVMQFLNKNIKDGGKIVPLGTTAEIAEIIKQNPDIKNYISK